MSRILIDISILLNILGFGQGIFLCLLLWRSKKNKPENIYLIYLLLAISVIILNTIIRLGDYISPLGFFENFSNTFLLAIAPSVYLFTKAKTKQITSKRTKWIHYLPFLLYFSFILISQMFYKTKSFEEIHIIAYFIFNIQFVSYFTLSLISLNNIKPLPEQLKWVRIATWLIIIPWFLQLAFIVTEKISGIITPDFINLNLSLIFGVCAFLLSYAHTSGNVGFAKKEKYENSKLSTEILDRNLRVIQSTINDNELFLDKNISLAKVAKKVKLSPRDVSLTINQATKQSFVDYINSYRIDTFKKLILKPSSKNYTMVALAESCGFKSSSAFYAAFKKQTGITPKQYKDNLNLEA
ncbi:helix-turn-helix domain-containing protein [Pontimicrobium aquaticum]|uniref:Helix-turn-helix domain-containing protein n=1 Tax=Pontimicrobium aquaticum TaxID=2565367 RepID=A0A4U0F0Z3_9FLAO|nr:helix-turn-helix transcriptional regulator [Pontimicrobium aquaticum]TJY38077.1 helix-turn-helix domain-containing protein [Pontimicrobium aquaticum]